MYLSSKEYNGYASLQEVASIIKKQYPQMRIFSVEYFDNNQKVTKQLAKKLK